MSYPENTRHLPSVVLMLSRRRRRRANIKTTLGQYLVFAGYLALSATFEYLCYGSTAIMKSLHFQWEDRF